MIWMFFMALWSSFKYRYSEDKCKDVFLIQYIWFFPYLTENVLF